MLALHFDRAPVAGHVGIFGRLSGTAGHDVISLLCQTASKLS